MTRRVILWALGLVTLGLACLMGPVMPSYTVTAHRCQTETVGHVTFTRCESRTGNVITYTFTRTERWTDHVPVNP